MKLEGIRNFLQTNNLPTLEEVSKELLSTAHSYAIAHSGCRKVQVGSMIGRFYIWARIGFSPISRGANVSVPNLCLSEGCLRVQKYGEDSKNHRLPSDCRAIHSEIDAIINALPENNCYYGLSGATIVVTRYPCEACARAIVAAGIETVIYGRKQKISEETEKIFASADVDVLHISDWDAEDTER